MVQLPNAGIVHQVCFSCRYSMGDPQLGRALSDSETAENRINVFIFR